MSRRPPDASIAAAVFLGGILGTLARAGVAEALPAGGAGGVGFPWATLLVNVAGAALLGWASHALTGHELRRHLIGTGVCGALTTFSTFQVELIQLARHDRVGLAAGYLAASLAAGLVGMHLVTALTRRVRIR
jgi:CrcB protein